MKTLLSLFTAFGLSVALVGCAEDTTTTTTDPAATTTDDAAHVDPAPVGGDAAAPAVDPATDPAAPAADAPANP
jgi:hypothetical protein